MKKLNYILNYLLLVSLRQSSTDGFFFVGTQTILICSAEEYLRKFPQELQPDLRLPASSLHNLKISKWVIGSGTKTIILLPDLLQVRKEKLFYPQLLFCFSV